MVGKNPHRPEGKANADNERMQASWMSPEANAGDLSPKRLHDRDMEIKERVSEPTRHPAEEQVGGSRPGVESRVKEALARIDDRETDREEREARDGE